MAVYRNRGIVLRSMRYREADRILDLYTQDAGMISAVAKGVRKTKSRVGGRLEPLSCVEFLAYQGRSMDTITQVETLRSFKAVRENLTRFEAAARFVGYVRALSGGDEADRRVFNLTYNALDALETRDSAFDILEAAFGLKLSVLAGYAPQLDTCANCDEPVSESTEVRYAPALGGVLCAGCSGTVGGSSSRDSFLLAPGVLESLRKLVGMPLREVPQTDTLGEALRRVTRSHIIANSPSGTLGVMGRRPA